MSRTISFEEFEELIDLRENLIKSILPNIIFISIIISFLWIITQNYKIIILINSVSILIYLIIIKLKLDKYNNLLNIYEKQEEIEKLKMEIKKWINKLNDLLYYLNLDEARIQYNIDKILESIEQADEIKDYENIIEDIKAKIYKYSELLDENETYYHAKINQHQSTNYSYNHKNMEKPKEINEELIKNLNILELKELPLTEKELKTKYREVLKKYHPDNAKNKLIFTESQLEQKTIEINIAYDYLKKIYK